MKNQQIFGKLNKVILVSVLILSVFVPSLVLAGDTMEDSWYSGNYYDDSSWYSGNYYDTSDSWYSGNYYDTSDSWYSGNYYDYDTSDSWYSGNFYDDYSSNSSIYREYEVIDIYDSYEPYYYDYGSYGSYYGGGFSIYRDYGCGSSCGGDRNVNYKYTDKSKVVYNYNDSSINDSYNSIVYRDYNDDDDDDYDYDDFDVVCRVSDTSIDEDDDVTIEVDVDGGDSPYEYRWYGDIDDIDDFEDDVRRQTVEIEDEGRYEISVRVEDDDGNVEYDDCPVIRVGDDDDDDDDYDVNVYGSGSSYYGTPASLSSVYLSQVPYTGASDWALFIGLIALAILISIFIAKQALKRNELRTRKQAINSFKQENLLKKGII